MWRQVAELEWERQREGMDSNTMREIMAERTVMQVRRRLCYGRESDNDLSGTLSEQWVMEVGYVGLLVCLPCPVLTLVLACCRDLTGEPGQDARGA